MRGLGDRSIDLDAEDLKDAVQFIVGTEADLDGAAAGAVTEADLGGEAFAEAVFDVDYVGVAGVGGVDRRGGGRDGLGGEELGDEFLSLADVEAALADLFGGRDLEGVIGEAQEDLGVADGEEAGAEGVEKGRSQLEEAEGVGDGGAAATDLLGDLFLGEFELGLELGVTGGFLQRIQVLALEVLDEGEFEDLAVGGGPFDDGNLGQAGQAGSAPATFAGDEFEAFADGADDEGLDDPLFADGVGQFAEGFLGEVAPRLERAGNDAVESDLANAVGGWGGSRRCGWGCWRDRCQSSRWRRGRTSAAAQQRTQASSQRRLRHGAQIRDRTRRGAMAERADVKVEGLGTGRERMGRERGVFAQWRVAYATCGCKGQGQGLAPGSFCNGMSHMRHADVSATV